HLSPPYLGLLKLTLGQFQLQQLPLTNTGSKFISTVMNQSSIKLTIHSRFLPWMLHILQQQGFAYRVENHVTLLGLNNI
ncbi:MAG: hypothetical protein M0P99_01425, partial [Candidatus Cloacimonetes bacterium]|nr:hypothetical protein [Candidatus Cloacimonadota bacterium]